MRGRQTIIGLLLASAIFAGWLALTLYGFFGVDLATHSTFVGFALVIVLCWLDVGLFIVAHDAMHGSLAPGRPHLNGLIGTTALLAYAGFSFDRLAPKHMQHHRAPGTVEDPDFHAPAPTNVFRWYAAFFREYFGIREVIVLTVAVAVLTFALRVPYVNLLLFWALPAILSSLQLFWFGTFLPHAHRGVPFADEHRAHSSDYPWLVSLLTCYHFGYHHEHHRHPHLPWWRLPAARSKIP
ncbi:fatty acid desaturase [Sphingomonas montanisoli]|uniref:Beta-carotene ketolase n=1 Tax=Sphingomonas montanisoli TaxID=2606412 RepID=A0A5D9C7S1_9SPHN|nr:fatty acid desaturase [Sphingomonas montanisoli]TZG27307.1 beta-carotene ketolase [Sphingomonas montanisoli]